MVDVKTQKYRVLRVDGTPSAELYVVVDGTNRNGRVKLAELSSIVHNDRGEIASAKYLTEVITSRLLSEHANRAARVTVDESGTATAECPICATTAEVHRDNNGSFACREHGEFLLGWPAAGETQPSWKIGRPRWSPAENDAMVRDGGAAAAAPRPRSARPRPAQAPVDVAAVAAAGELWVKNQVNFDCDHIRVLAYVLLVPAAGGHRKFCFNTYNGIMGKKAGELDLSMFAAPDGGFAVADVVRERARLTKNGYVIFAD